MRIWYYLCLMGYLRVRDHVSFYISFSIQNLENRLHYKPLEEKKWRRDLLQQLEFCTCILLLLVMKPHNMELEEMGISVKVILSAKNVLGLACTYLYSFLKIPSWNIATASAFCLPRFVQMLFKVMQLK